MSARPSNTLAIAGSIRLTLVARPAAVSWRNRGCASPTIQRAILPCLSPVDDGGRPSQRLGSSVGRATHS
jgi:hypothetical protein